MTLSQGQGLSIQARDAPSGPETRHQGQGPYIKAKDPWSGPGILNQSQGVLIRVRYPWSGQGTLLWPRTANQGQIGAKDLTLFPRILHQSLGPLIRASDPWSGPGSPHLGQGPSVWARDPLFGPGNIHLGQGPFIWAKDPSINQKPFYTWAKISIFRLYSNNITVRDTFAYKHTLIACVIVHGSLSIIKTSTAGGASDATTSSSLIDYDVIWWLFRCDYASL